MIADDDLEEWVIAAIGILESIELSHLACISDARNIVDFEVFPGLDEVDNIRILRILDDFSEAVDRFFLRVDLPDVHDIRGVQNQKFCRSTLSRIKYHRLICRDSNFQPNSVDSRIVDTHKSQISKVEE